MGALLLLASAVAAAPAALAVDGPGYGGTADGLSVSWTESDTTLHAMGPGEAVQLTPDTLSLDVYGLGFRGRSEVTVAVGTSEPLVSRVDPTGTLDLSVRVTKLSEGPQPGTSVVVLGRAPGGSSRTLVGAVPPLPSGLGPADVIPWLVGGALTVVAGTQWRRRRVARAVPAEPRSGTARGYRAAPVTRPTAAPQHSVGTSGA